MNKYLPAILLCLFLFSNCKKENLSKNDKTKALAPGQKEGEELLLRLDGRWYDQWGYRDQTFIITDTAGKLITALNYPYPGQPTEIYGPSIPGNLVNVYSVLTNIS